jgi:hypothetical protein
MEKVVVDLGINIRLTPLHSYSNLRMLIYLCTIDRDGKVR